MCSHSHGGWEERELRSGDAPALATVEMWLHGGGAGVCSRPCGTGTILPSLASSPASFCAGASRRGHPGMPREPHSLLPTVALGGERQILHSTSVVTVPLVPVCYWERDSHPKFCLPSFSGYSVHTELLPPLPPLPPAPFLPRDSGISAGLGREEGQKPLPCQKRKRRMLLSPSVRHEQININPSLHPAVPLSCSPSAPVLLPHSLSHDPAYDTFPVPLKQRAMSVRDMSSPWRERASCAATGSP